MSYPKIKIMKTHEDAALPASNNADTCTGDTGYDLVAVESAHIEAGSSEVVSVGLTLADISPGYWIRIEPRSGLGFKHNIQPHLGVIDNGYRGDLAVKLYNFSRDDGYTVKKGDKIAQLAVYPLLQPEFSFSDSITETPRGNKGFGSSDQPNISESACDMSKTEYDTTDLGGIIDADDENPWKFTDVEVLIKWARNKPEIYDELFEDLVRNTIKNRELLKNV
jgi:dUTP pyrophosphatase